MILVSIQMGKQFSTPGKAKKVFLGDGLKGEKSRRKWHAKKLKKRKKNSQDMETLLNIRPRTVCFIEPEKDVQWT